MENWKVESDEYGYSVVDQNNKLVCDVDSVQFVDCDCGLWDELTHKRAKRIAACNEMLRALKAIARNPLYKVYIKTRDMRRIEEAIKKAEQ